VSYKIDRKLKRALNETGLDWEIRSGTNHFKIFIEGRMATIAPHGSRRDCDRHLTNQICQVRRAAARIKEST